MTLHHTTTPDRNSTSAISQLLLTRCWPNFKDIMTLNEWNEMKMKMKKRAVSSRGNFPNRPRTCREIVASPWADFLLSPSLNHPDFGKIHSSPWTKTWLMNYNLAEKCARYQSPAFVLPSFLILEPVHLIPCLGGALIPDLSLLLSCDGGGWS